MARCLEQVRLFSAEPISFKCRCSAEKVATTLISLGRETVDEILAEQGEVIADCEFCSRLWQLFQRSSDI
jgi:molecular chaperone Hsp33